MLRQRVITAIVLVAILLAFLFAPFAASLAFFALVITLAGWEWGGLVPFASAGRVLYALVIAALLGGCWWLLLDGDRIDMHAARDILGGACVVWAILLLWVITYPGTAAIWGTRPALVVLGILVLVPAWVGLAFLRLHEQGAWLILYVIGLVVCADTGAYFTGRALGKHKMAPRVSPGKTLEGLAGGMATVALFAVVVSFLLAPVGLPVGSLLVLSLCAGMASVLGDLVESMAKRHAGVKDSGTLLPGHGGVLDRIDSLAAAIPVFSFGMVVMQLQRGL